MSAPPAHPLLSPLVALLAERAWAMASTRLDAGTIWRHLVTGTDDPDRHPAQWAVVGRSDVVRAMADWRQHPLILHVHPTPDRDGAWWRGLRRAAFMGGEAPEGVVVFPWRADGCDWAAVWAARHDGQEVWLGVHHPDVAPDADAVRRADNLGAAWCLAFDPVRHDVRLAGDGLMQADGTQWIHPWCDLWSAAVANLLSGFQLAVPRLPWTDDPAWGEMQACVWLRWCAQMGDEAAARAWLAGWLGPHLTDGGAVSSAPGPTSAD